MAEHVNVYQFALAIRSPGYLTSIADTVTHTIIDILPYCPNADYDPFCHNLSPNVSTQTENILQTDETEKVKSNSNA